MADHTHHAGGWMLSYRYMHMQMDGMRSGTSSISPAEIFNSYHVSPESMRMDMHMFGFMYAFSDQLTVMLMANYIDNEMEHRINPSSMLIMANGGNDAFTTATSGLGDTRVTALYKFIHTANTNVHAGIGLSLPTGSIDETDAIPMMNMGLVDSVLPAPMQLGSGTVDLLPSITLRQEFAQGSYGIQGNGVIRLQDENNRNYRLGHQLGATGWAGYLLTDWLSVNGGLSYLYSGELQGDQQGINQGPMMGLQTVTTAYAENYGGQRVEAIVGLNLLKQSGTLQGHRIALDLRVPLWQDLNGVQLETDYTLTLGWQKAW